MVNEFLSLFPRLRLTSGEARIKIMSSCYEIDSPCSNAWSAKTRRKERSIEKGRDEKKRTRESWRLWRLITRETDLSRVEIRSFDPERGGERQFSPSIDINPRIRFLLSFRGARRTELKNATGINYRFPLSHRLIETSTVSRNNNPS